MLSTYVVYKDLDIMYGRHIVQNNVRRNFCKKYQLWKIRIATFADDTALITIN